MAEKPGILSEKFGTALSEKLKPQLSDNDKANLAFQYLADLSRNHYPFSNAQYDIAVGLPMSLLPPNDRDTLIEIARSNTCPLWQAIYAQFRRTNEGGVAFALILDPGWLQDESVRLEGKECPECHTIFTPANFGQKFCGNDCGSAEDRRRIAKLQEQKPVVAALVAALVAEIDPFDLIEQKAEKEPAGFVPPGAERLAAQIRN